MTTGSRTARLAALSMFTLATTACGGGSSSPTPPPATTVTTATADATGDATTPAGGGTGWDITQVATSRPITGATALTISVTYAQAVSAANLQPPGTALTAATHLGTAIIFATGGPGNMASGLTGCVGNPSFPNATYVLDPGAVIALRAADGNFSIVSLGGSGPAKTGEATLAFTGQNTVTYTIPLAAIGGGSGAVQIAAVAFTGTGTGSGPMSTDCAPNASYIST